MVPSEFGQHVADIVIEVTDDKTLPKDERKRRQIEAAPKKSREAKLIKLADKTSNLRTIARSPAADWSVERRLEYIEWAKAVVAGLRGISPWLEQQFDEAAVAAERSINPPMPGMRADAGLHTDQARRQVGEPRFHLAAWPLLPQHDGTVAIMTHDVERVFADIDPDHGDLCVECLRHGVLLVLSAPCQLLVLAGPEHGRTIPLTDVGIRPLPRCGGS